MRAGPPCRDRGNAALELVILAPVILFFLGLMIAAGRTSIAQGSVLGQDAIDCAPIVTVNVSGFAVPVGLPAQVTAQVTCRVSLSDLLVPGMPGSKTLTATFTSPLDPYRAR